MARLAMIASILLSLVIHGLPVALPIALRVGGGEMLQESADVGLVPDVRAPEARPTPSAVVLRRSLEAIQRDRQALIEEAREARRHDRLALGDFMLRAAALDAEQLGYAVDIAEARRRYEAGLASVKAQQHSGADILSVLREAYGALHYQSIGGSMADALLDGGGSCEQMTHLFAATVHDAGLADQIFVAYWGAGPGHLAPLYRYGARDYDLVAGREAAPGGARFPAAELVEIYARAHGLAGGPADGAKGASHHWSDGRASFAGGYPPNDDGHVGAVPIFSVRALGGGVGADDAPVDAEDDGRCFLWPYELWTQPTIAITPAASDGKDAALPYEIEWRRLPFEDELAWRAYRIAAAEARLSLQPALPRMLVEACIAVAYEELAIDFALLRMHALSRTSLARAEAMRAHAVETLVSVDRSDAGLAALRERDDLWTLAHIPGAETLVGRVIGGVSYGRAREGLDPVANQGIPYLLAASLQRDAAGAAAVAAFSRLEPLDQYVLASQIAMIPGVVAAAQRLAPDSDLTRGLAAIERFFHEAILPSGPGQDLARDYFGMMRRAGFPPRWLEAMEKEMREPH